MRNYTKKMDLFIGKSMKLINNKVIGFKIIY